MFDHVAVIGGDKVRFTIKAFQIFKDRFVVGEELGKKGREGLVFFGKGEERGLVGEGKGSVNSNGISRKLKIFKI